MSVKTVVVTGVSSGIGESTAALLVAEGFRVFGAVRHDEDGVRLSARLGQNFSPLMMDVTDGAAIAAAAAEVDAALGGTTLAGLVNNAGIAIGGPLALLPLGEIRHQLEVNLIGQIGVTQVFLPLLGADRTRSGKPGRIVNVSSVSGKRAMPFMGPYAASKHALEAVSESLRRELMLFGIDVVIVAPGTVATPIWDKARELDTTRFENSEYASALARMLAYVLDIGPKGDPPERTARVIHHALTAPSPKPRYAPVHGKFMNWTLPALLPKRFVDRKIARGLGLIR
jgi:NAD(P)-dependent dehydrogenase (short-subunit alcohol dehydrogenase family)